MDEEKEIQKRERINKLLSIYGNALSKLQREDLLSYYQDDLSLSEIALNRNVTRNAVHLSIRNGEKELEKYEKDLHILLKSEQIEAELDKIEKASDEERKKIVDRIKEELKYGI
jgi:predicted DNA-binding protein YlxM (UPF0122 family)